MKEPFPYTMLSGKQHADFTPSHESRIVDISHQAWWKGLDLPGYRGTALAKCPPSSCTGLIISISIARVLKVSASNSRTFIHVVTLSGFSATTVDVRPDISFSCAFRTTLPSFLSSIFSHQLTFGPPLYQDHCKTLATILPSLFAGHCAISLHLPFFCAVISL